MRQSNSPLIRLLIWSERYTKTDMVYLASQSGWLFIGQGAVFVSSFILAWVFANYMNPADYGLYKFVVTAATIASITTLTGMGIATARAVAQGHHVSLPRLIRIKLRYGALGALALFGFALYYLYKDNELLATLFAVTAIWIPFFDSFSDYQYVLQGFGNFRLQTILRLIQRLLLTSVVIATILLFQNIILITLLYFAAMTASQYVMYRYLIARYPATDDRTTPYQEIITYGKRISYMNIFFIGAGQIDKILLFQFLGPTQLAIYFFAIAIPQELQGVLGNINAVAFPKLVDKTSHEFKVAFVRKILIYTLLLIPVVVSYILVSPFLFKIFFPSYLDSVFVSQFFIGTLFFTPMSLLWHYFYAIEHKSAIFAATVIGPSVFIIALVLLVPFYGLIGAVLAVYVRLFLDLFTASYFFARVGHHIKFDKSTSA